MHTPSPDCDAKKARSVLLEGLARYAYQYRPDEPFTLASGATSPEYLDCRLALSHPHVLAAAAELLFESLGRDAEAIGGLTMGADPIAVAVSLYSRQQPRTLQWFTVRKEPKGHGQGRRVEGDIARGTPVVVVEDVTTSGGSALNAARALGDFGAQVVEVVSIVDREAGGLEAISRELGPEIPVRALVTRSDVRAAWDARQLLQTNR